ncbi:hypothetical protein EU537_00445 [Candidatus Thorarchaeota archaeon]|nr:MAG: hypothetical protein EU537_00445 [Candidatus Thorarchaeota archaeon]
MPENEKDPEAIRDSLDDIVEKLDQTTSSSQQWGETMSTNRERWEELKAQIHSRQKRLKELVLEKKAGNIGKEEFDEKYQKIQKELTALEFQIYNLRLGTEVEVE